MRAIIPAAGIGKRLSSVHEGPKCLLKIGDETLIQRHVRHLNEFGMKEVVVIVGYEKEKIMEHLGESYKDTKIIYAVNDNYTAGNMLSLYAAKDYLDDDIVIIDADVFCDKNIMRKIVESDKKDSLLFDSSFLAEDGYQAIGKDGYVITVDYKLEKPEGGVIGEIVGVTRLSRENVKLLVDKTKEFIDKGETNLLFDEMVKDLMEKEIIKVQYIDAAGMKWAEIDFPEDVEKAKEIYPEIKD
jgi:choline kinase